VPESAYFSPKHGLWLAWLHHPTKPVILHRRCVEFFSTSTGLMIHVYYNRFESTRTYDRLLAESSCWLKNDPFPLGLAGLSSFEDDKHNSINIGNVAVRFCIYVLIVLRNILVLLHEFQRIHVGISILYFACHENWQYFHSKCH
jgi:hypothetical protein